MIDPKTVKVIRLISGDEFFAEVEDRRGVDGIVRVKNPLVLNMVPAEGGKVIVRFEHWLGYTEKTEVNLKGDHVLFCEPLMQRFTDLYCQQFNKIVTPNQGIVTL